MNGFLDLFISDIGGVSSSNESLSSRYLLEKFENTPVAKGRFEFMSYFLAGSIVYSATAALSLYYIFQNTTKKNAILITLAAALIGIVWTYSAIVYDNSSPSYQILFTLTNDLALTQYDNSFALFALIGAKIHFGLALVTTALIILAGSLIMRGISTRTKLDKHTLIKKRDHLKILLIVTSLFLTLMAIYVSQWIAWPANFVKSLEASNGIGDAKEIKSIASNLRIYFGTGYSLTLLSFAIPAIITYTRCSAHLETASEKSKETTQFLFQRVFSKDEIGIVASILAPIVIPFLSALLG